MKTLKIILFVAASILLVSSYSQAYDFTYTIGDPSTVQAQQYIEDRNNVELWYEGAAPVYWKPIVGASTMAATIPGSIVYHFNFGTDVVESANLFIHMPTFNWWYSQGHNYLYGSTDNTNWVQLLDVTPPAYGGANGGYYNGSLPASLLGENDIYLKALLYSYGSQAPSGGVWTNTAQVTRWSGANTFKLDVDFKENGGGTTVPEPTTMLLLGLGLLGLAGMRRKIRH